MIYTADEEAMKEYSALIQEIAYLDYRRNAVLERIKQWETAHAADNADPSDAGTD